MNTKLILNFICKNEEHVIETMLKSNLSVMDMIVCTDTGSTDNTIEVIKKFGSDNNLPTYVFERVFDNFENSRNHALEMARQMTVKEGWDTNSTYTYWVDCDEVLVIEKSFDKNTMDKDLYMINARICAMVYTRNTFIKTSVAGRWYGPVHEYIVCDTPNITSGLVQGLYVDVKMTGASWKGDIGQKYLNHAHILERYINEKDRSSRWVFYTAQSYHDSATTQSKLENEERLKRAKKYYQERIDRVDGYEEERFYAQFRVGTILNALEAPWSETMQALVKAYAMDNLRAEPIMLIIEHYYLVQEPHMAYIYSKFAKCKLHGNNPYGARLLFLDSSLYNWKILEKHAVICMQCDFKAEGKETYKELLTVLRNNPSWFTPEEVQKIQANAQWFK